MSDVPQEKSKTQLALALAQGVSVAAWARSSGVPRRTAFTWAKDPAVRKVVESCRRRTIDQAVGRMTKYSTRAAEGIINISKEAESDTVRLRAFRAIFSDMMSVSKYSVLEGRMTEVEEKLDQRDAAANSSMSTKG